MACHTIIAQIAVGKEQICLVNDRVCSERGEPGVEPVSVFSSHFRRTHKPDTRSTDTVVVKGLGAGILYGSPCLSLCWLPGSSVGTSNPSHLLHLNHKQHREQFEFYGWAQKERAVGWLVHHFGLS